MGAGEMGVGLGSQEIFRLTVIRVCIGSKMMGWAGGMGRVVGRLRGGLGVKRRIKGKILVGQLWVIGIRLRILGGIK